MKLSIAGSVLLHVLILAVLFLIAREKVDLKKDIFYADLIRPEEGPAKKEKEALAPRQTLIPRSRPSAPSKAPSATQKRLQRGSLSPSKPAPERAPSSSGYDEKPAEGIKRQDTLRGERTAPAQSPTSPEREGRQGSADKRSFREKIFDQEVIKEIARADKPTPEKDGTITFDTKEFKYHGYLNRLRERIEGVWKYPREAAERGIYGDLYLKFTIKKNGRLANVELVRTSGHKILDDAAMKALREADPFWPVPDELGKETFTITGHFVYSIYGAYLR